jgi:hypothetical protein
LRQSYSALLYTFPASFPGSCRHWLSHLHLHYSLFTYSTAWSAPFGYLFLLSHLLKITMLGVPSPCKALFLLLKQFLPNLIWRYRPCTEAIICIYVLVLIFIINLFELIFILLLLILILIILLNSICLLRVHLNEVCWLLLAESP